MDKKSVVGTAEVHHHKPNGLAAEILPRPKHDVKSDLPNGGARQNRHNVVEGFPAGLQRGLRDPRLLNGVTIEDVDAAIAIDEDSREAACVLIGEEGRVQHQRIVALCRHDVQMVLVRALPPT
jgi:hypothetical protein